VQKADGKAQSLTKSYNLIKKLMLNYNQPLT